MAWQDDQDIGYQRPYKPNHPLSLADYAGIKDDKKNPYEYGLTLREIGNLLCISRDRVRQIEVKALKKMKKYLEEQGVEF